MKFVFTELKHNGFNKELLERTKMFDVIGSRLGDLAPKKRLLHVDYKEKGRDMNRSHVLYQPLGISDEQMVACLMESYEKKRCTVSAIVEVDNECRMIGVHYLRPGFLEECRQDMEKLFREHN